MEQLERLTVLGCDLAQGYNWRRPAAWESVDAWLTPPAGRLAADRVSRATGPVRTLLVDDRPELRAAIRLAMELDGEFAVVAEAADGRGAIDAAADVAPDLIVLDILMPGMSGLQALPGLRQAAPGAAIVLLTAVDRHDVADADLRGTLGIIDKTLDLDALVARLSQLLRPAAA
jgi:CheY-like chemotaxis protein